MARAALDLSLERAADLVGLNRNSLQRFEAGRLAMRPDNVDKMRAAYEQAGVALVGTIGVVLTKEVEVP